MKSHFAQRNRSGLALATLALILLVAPIGLADSGTVEAGQRGLYRGECRRLTRQLEHFEGTILPMAIQRGNRGWEDATNAHIDRLWNRRADLCPEYGAERSMLQKAADRTRKFNKMMSAAGRAALAFFTGGATGF